MASMQRPLMRPNADQASLSLKITEAGTVKSDVDKAADERERVDGGPDRWAARAAALARPGGGPIADCAARNSDD